MPFRWSAPALGFPAHLSSFLQENYHYHHHYHLHDDNGDHHHQWRLSTDYCCYSSTPPHSGWFSDLVSSYFGVFLPYFSCLYLSYLSVKSTNYRLSVQRITWRPYPRSSHFIFTYTRKMCQLISWKKNFFSVKCNIIALDSIMILVLRSICCCCNGSNNGTDDC